MIDFLKKELGSLDHLCFAFPQVIGVGSQSYGDPTAFIVGAIARTQNPPAGTVKSSVLPGHPLPSTYIGLDGISSVEIAISTNAAKKLLKRKRCLVIEKWRDEFVCRVPNYMRDGMAQNTIAIIGIPPGGTDWNLPVVEKMREVARALSEKR